MKKLIYLLAICGVVTACSTSQADKKEKGSEATAECCPSKQKVTMKKYTNEDFYVDGKLSAEKTLAAYKEMFEYYNYPCDQWLLDHMFITDFGLGDFANCGMAGVFWVNDEEHGYFAHEIYLLPNQMIAEHQHMETKNPAKFESWHVRHGIAYNFGEVGETANAPATPASQKDFITVDKYIKTVRTAVTTLNRAEAPHFMLGGPEGCIVSEYANFHDGAGLRFTNPKVAFTDILGNN